MTREQPHAGRRVRSRGLGRSRRARPKWLVPLSAFGNHYIYDEDGDTVSGQVPPYGLEVLPTTWIRDLREQGYSDTDIMEQATSNYAYGDWPRRVFDLVGTVIVNGEPLRRHHLARVRADGSGMVEEFDTRFEGNGNDESEDVARALFWCKFERRCGYVITSNEHVAGLWDVYISFSNEGDAAAFEARFARG